MLVALGLAVLCEKTTELTCRTMSVNAVCFRVKPGFSWYHCGGAQRQSLVLIAADLAGWR